MPLTRPAPLPRCYPAAQIEFDAPATWDAIKDVLIKNEFPPEGEQEVKG